MSRGGVSGESRKGEDKEEEAAAAVVGFVPGQVVTSVGQIGPVLPMRR